MLDMSKMLNLRLSTDVIITGGYVDDSSCEGLACKDCIFNNKGDINCGFYIGDDTDTKRNIELAEKYILNFKNN